MTSEELITYLDLRSHCSAFMKVADDFSDVWFGHNTWTFYNKMIRIYKEYKYVPNKIFLSNHKQLQCLHIQVLLIVKTIFI